MKRYLLISFFFLSTLVGFAQGALKVYRVGDQIVLDGPGGQTSYPSSSIAVRGFGSSIYILQDNVPLFQLAPAQFQTQSGVPYGSTVPLAMTAYLLNVPGLGGGSGGVAGVSSVNGQSGVVNLTIPTVPTNLSSFTNDLNLLNSSQVNSAINVVTGPLATSITQHTADLAARLLTTTYTANRTTDQAATTAAQNTANAAVPTATYNSNRTTDQAATSAAQTTANAALPTATYNTNRATDQAATTAAQNTANAAVSTTTYNTNRTTDQATVAGKAPLASPAFTGVPTVPTATSGTNTSQAASTSFVQGAIAGVGVNLTIDSTNFLGDFSSASPLRIRPSLLALYQPLLTTGNATQYRKGDNTLGTLLTDVRAAFTGSANIIVSPSGVLSYTTNVGDPLYIGAGVNYIGGNAASIQFQRAGSTFMEATAGGTYMKGPTYNFQSAVVIQSAAGISNFQSNTNLGIGTGATASISTLNVLGSISSSIVSVTANYTASETDNTIAIDASSGVKTIALLTAAGRIGRVYEFVRVDAGTNAITIDPAGSETIKGAATLNVTNGMIIKALTATSWVVISSY
ncbi:hypothetical protein [Spirosoma flavum]|uniref:Uncharacterized protein n=1 Tax=Spirosoma flavum TaxID=2048557 RepID=A0ABW6AM19_9BACT